jgi:hypothetical protein
MEKIIMAITRRPSPIQEQGFKKIMLQEREAQRKIEEQKEKFTVRDEKVMKLKEKFENTEDLALGGGKLDEMFHSNPHKAENFMLFLDQTEKSAVINTTLQENVKKYESLKEAVQTSGFMGVTPQDIVKIARIAYPNSVAADLFDFWGMSSMKDSIYKLETLYGSSARGATANAVIYENYNEGRYPSTYEEDLPTVTAVTAFTGTLTTYPVLPFQVSVFVNNIQVAIDDGNGKLVGVGLNTGLANDVSYTAGTWHLNFTVALASTDVLTIRYAYDSEQTSLFTGVGSVLMDLIVYDYRAIPWPIAIEWTRFTEELMQSKLGLSAKETLIAGAGDIFRKSIDEFCIGKGRKAGGWATAQNFDTDFASAGSDSSIEHAQSLIQAIVNAEMLTYNQLGRLADKSNLVIDAPAYTYMTKHRLFNAYNAPSKIGIFKVGELAGRDVYMAPPNVMGSVATQGQIQIFGKGSDPMSVDSCVSVGTWKAGLETNPVELKNFNSQMGLAMYADIRTNNKYFATSVQLTNLTSNS